MKVLNIIIKDQNGQSIELEKALLIKDRGIDGDKNAKGGDRQISLLPLTIRKMIQNESIEGICIKRYKENITYSGGSLIKGESYKMGDSKILITEKSKTCFPECVNIIDNLYCPLIENAIFAKVTKTGYTKLKDEIEQCWMR